jgi:hypothetical protein
MDRLKPRSGKRSHRKAQKALKMSVCQLYNLGSALMVCGDLQATGQKDLGLGTG